MSGRGAGSLRLWTAPATGRGRRVRGRRSRSAPDDLRVALDAPTAWRKVQGLGGRSSRTSLEPPLTWPPRALIARLCSTSCGPTDRHPTTAPSGAFTMVKARGERASKHMRTVSTIVPSEPKSSIRRTKREDIVDTAHSSWRQAIEPAHADEASPLGDLALQPRWWSRTFLAVAHNRADRCGLDQGFCRDGPRGKSPLERDGSRDRALTEKRRPDRLRQQHAWTLGGAPDLRRRRRGWAAVG